MTNAKISALTGATTPLAGTETLPVVQGGATKQVSVADLTLGRAVTTAGGTFTDNQIQGTAAKGINFTANTPAAGMTSQLLNVYEEGTWTPTGTGFTVVGSATWTGSYIRIGKLVYWQAKVVATTSIATAGGASYIAMPFTIQGGAFSSLGTATNASSFIGLGNGMYVNGSTQFYSPAITATSTVVFSGIYQTS